LDHAQVQHIPTLELKQYELYYSAQNTEVGAPPSELLMKTKANLTFIGPCIANVFSEYNQQPTRCYLLVAAGSSIGLTNT